MKHLVTQLIDKLRSYKDFEEAIKAIRKNSYGPIFLVGGKVYRTLSEIIHGGDFKATSVDWDALVMGEVKMNYVPRGWEVAEVYDERTKKHSLGFQKNGTKPRWGNPRMGLIRMGGYRGNNRYIPPSRARPQHKIDLIGIKDIPGNGTLQSYFDCVPLDIQAIALCLDTQTIHGVKAMEAIRRKHIKVNSTTGALPGLDVNVYLPQKADSMGYTYEGQIVQKTPCNCFGGDTKALFDHGCKLPNFHC